MHQFLVEVVPHHHDRSKWTLWNDRGEFKAGDREQEHVHGAAENPAYFLFCRTKLTNIATGSSRRYEAGGMVVQHFDEIAVNATGHSDQVISRLITVNAL